MLTIRMQRRGRKGHAQFRVVAQDSKFNPQSGRVVAYLGFYDPHTKVATIDSEKTAKFLENGAQPSDRVVRILQKEGVKLPSWIKVAESKGRTVRHPEKRRSTAPKPKEETTLAEAEIKPQEPAAEETGTPTGNSQPTLDDNSA
jgi:small subunit ribosomal protein S16